MKTELYVSRPLEVEAVQVDEDNLYDVAKWCQGLVWTDKEGTKFVKVRVINPGPNMLSEAEVGCWVLKSEKGFKVYNESAFETNFMPAPRKKIGSST